MFLLEAKKIQNDNLSYCKSVFKFYNGILQA